MKSLTFKAAFLAVTVSVAGFTIAAAAQTALPRPADFENRKAAQLKRIDQRIARLQEARSCIQNANNEDAVKACGEKLRMGNKRMGPRSGQSS